ncbi:sugar ABC transporter permease [Amygdalobacter indicium]|uniref:Sugar ABC transporter permease n=1 Tax=Amygdalobacter indicium TaxID=3029272 RepID=A0ABY8C548_9FIRM|nr:sugar ABC transporter permease [Amygdalobacter indicium]WEG35803.1 sugar ABC transporter permease [Amygdalobacter indicium]
MNRKLELREVFSLNITVKRKIEPYLWLAPSFVLFALFVFYPFFITLYKSFYIVDSLGAVRKFVGANNYLYILKDKEFIQAILNTLYFALLTVPASKVIGLLLAMLAYRKHKLSILYETSFAIPMTIASSTAAMIFQLLYVPTLGFINGITGLQIRWLTDPKVAMFSIALIQIWLSSGYAFVFLLSAVRNIPEAVLESASIDGATGWRKMIFIILPLISPTMFYLIVMDIPFSIMMVSLNNVLTQGGPNNSTMTVMLYIYNQIALVGNNTYANAATMIAFIITLGFILLGFAFEKKGVHYQ